MRFVPAAVLSIFGFLAIPVWDLRAQSTAEPAVQSSETILHTTTNLVLVDVVDVVEGALGIVDGVGCV